VGTVAVGGLTELDAVTLDLYGTVVTLRDPVPNLVETLQAHGVDRRPEAVQAAFEAEFAYYDPHSHEGRDEPSVADLNRRCANVFLEALGADLDPAEFAPLYVAALVFEPLPAAPETLRALRSRGLDLAAVTNWDVTVHERLSDLGLAPLFSHVVTSAEIGARKPDPAPFRRALNLLQVLPQRTLHIGDDEVVDRQGATAAGMRFAFAPLERALAGLL
jgi:putative hydrolase of the HAD superfamily